MAGKRAFEMFCAKKDRFIYIKRFRVGGICYHQVALHHIKIVKLHVNSFMFTDILLTGSPKSPIMPRVLYRVGGAIMVLSDDKWISIEEAAEYLGVNKDSIRNWIKKEDSEIPAHKIGKQWKFKKSELDEWVKSGKSAMN